MEQNLTPVIEAYQKGKLSRETAIQKVAVYCYRFLQKKYEKDEDRASEIFCVFYRRIPRLIDIFKFRGKPFEIYLHIALKRVSVTYSENKERGEILKRHCEEIFCEDNLYTLPEEPRDTTDNKMDGQVLSYFGLNTEEYIRHGHLRRRLLCLVFKSAYHISYSHIQKTSILTGVGQGWLESRIQELKKGMAHRLERHSYLSNRRRESLARSRLYHENSLGANAREKQELYSQRYYRTEKRIRKLSNAISRVPLSPTHAEIAKVLELPKGSVDSGLYYIKNAFADKYDRDSTE